MCPIDEILEICIRKCLLNGKGPEYLPLLVEDEVKNYLFREEVNRRSMEIMGRRNDVLDMPADPVPSTVS